MTSTEPDRPYDETLDEDGNPEIGPSIFKIIEKREQEKEREAKDARTS